MAECDTTDDIYAAPLVEGQIRVLALQPGEGHDILECQIHVVDPASGETPPYDAISYVWGSRNAADIIRCEMDGDGGGQVPLVCLPLAQNAADALRAVRLVDGVRRVWIDSICISQTSSVEKTAQVAMMDNIFANAATVRIWLGADDGGQSAAAAEVATLIHAQFGHEMHSARRGETIEQEGTPAQQRCYDKVGSLLPLFECEWFWRSWCVQELALANESLMYWGSTVFTWDVILTAAAFIQSKAQLHVAHMGVAGVYNVVMLEALRARIKSVRNFDPFELDDETDDMPFSRLLSLTRLHGVTEPCDKIFSLLGLDRRLRIHPTERLDQRRILFPRVYIGHARHSDQRLMQPLVIPDYSRSLDSVYLSTARALIDRERNLHLLSFVQHDGEVGQVGLPSWVPLWHINKHRLITQLDLIPGHPVHTFLETALQESSFDESPEARASIHWPAGEKRTAVDSDGALLAEGLLLATVTQVCSDAIFTVERSHQWVATLRQWLLCVSSWFMYHDQTDRPNAPASELDDVVFHMFYRTILGGHFRAKELFTGLQQELAIFRALLSSDGTNTTDRCPITHAYVAQMCRSRTSFLTDSGKLGIGPQCLQTGDSVCYLAGAAIPLLLRARSSPDATHRRWLLVGETYVDGLTRAPPGKADRDFETLTSRQAIYSNESLHCNEDDKDARSLPHIPHLERRKNFLHALQGQDLRIQTRPHLSRCDVWYPFDGWCDRMYRFAGPSVAGELSARASVNLARRVRFCID